MLHGRLNMVSRHEIGMPIECKYYDLRILADQTAVSCNFQQGEGPGRDLIQALLNMAKVR